jgi:hypothetical protein
MGLQASCWSGIFAPDLIRAKITIWAQQIKGGIWIRYNPKIIAIFPYLWDKSHIFGVGVLPGLGLFNNIPANRASYCIVYQWNRRLKDKMSKTGTSRQ